MHPLHGVRGLRINISTIHKDFVISSCLNGSFLQSSSSDAWSKEFTIRCCGAF